MTKEGKKTVAIMTPIYNEIEILEELCRRVTEVMDALSYDWKLVCVDDGSTDGSREWLLDHAGKMGSGELDYLLLSRNFGLNAAVHAGVSQIDVDALVVMDGDLQDPPEFIPELLAVWEGGVDVVIARRSSRAESYPKRFLIGVFHRLFHSLSDYAIPHGVGNFSLLSFRAVETLRSLPERNRFFPALRSWIGYPSKTVFYDRDDRSLGSAKQTFKRLISLASDAIFSFSYKPLRVMTAFGAVVSGLGFALALSFVLKRLLGIEIAETGFTTLITMILFLGGIQLLSLGIVGEYILRIYDEAKGRPIHILEKDSSAQIYRKRRGG